MLLHFVATMQQGLKIRKAEREGEEEGEGRSREGGKDGEREYMAKQMSDFISSASTQCSMPSANTGTAHAISKSCLS